MAELVHHRRSSPNWSERNAPITMVVLHYTGMQSAEAAIDRLCDPEASVSAHYVIDEEGTVTQLVDEAHRARHAGVSKWREVTDVNSASVGIELVNPGHEFGYRPFPEAQMQALLPLLDGIVKRYRIPLANVVGHSDVAPRRKEDPGELFDWERLAAHHLAVARPTVAMHNPYEDDTAFFTDLDRYGYDISDTKAAMRAFQRRWRPRQVNGLVDDECSAILFALRSEATQGA